MTAGARSRSIAVAAAAAAAVFVGFAGMILGGWVKPPALQLVDDLVLAVLATLAAVLCARSARPARGRTRAAWVLMAISMVAYAVGEYIWCYYDLVVDESPFPSAADVFFLIFPVASCAGLLLFRNRSGGASDWRIVLDGLIVAGSLFIVSWTLVLGRIYEAGAAGRLEFVLLVTYPLSDLVIMTVSAVVLVSAKAGQRITMTLLTLGLVGMAASDGGYAYLSAQENYGSGDVVDIGWVAGLLLISLGAMLGRRVSMEPQPGDELPGWTSVWLPYAPLMLSGIVVMAVPPSPGTARPVFVAGLLLMVTVLARQFLAVSEDRRLVKTVADQALRDPLTGLANRALFQDRLNHALQLRQRYGTAVGVMVLDLDDFKLINDTLGHPAGDELLSLVGERISASVRGGDTVARLGGDEFAVMVEGETRQTDAVARRVLAAFDSPISVDGHDLLIRASLGLAVAAPEATEVSAEDLLKQADLAMYVAKRSTNTDVQIFTAGMQLADALDPEALRRRSPGVGADAVQLLGELRRSLDNDQFALVYQPKYDLMTLQMVGAEALLRWHHPERGLLTPDQFLPLVRGHQLMDAVTEFVINGALDAARAWCRAGVTLPVAVNLSATSMAIPDLPERIENALRARDLEPSMLVVEITEDLFLEDSDRTRQVLVRLRGRGVRIAIDDFGSGYSALWYLRDLPVDEVKLDRSFVAPIAIDPKAAAVVRAVVDLAHVLLLTTVAEGVEDLRTAELLRSFGCDVVQGFFYSPPVTADEVLGMCLADPIGTR